jgi:hypothetical protein
MAPEMAPEIRRNLRVIPNDPGPLCSDLVTGSNRAARFHVFTGTGPPADDAARQGVRMRPITVRRLGAAAAAVAAGLLVTVLGGCGSSPGLPSASSTIPASAPAGGPVASAAGPASAAPTACSLLRQADVLAVAATFRGATITIDGHSQVSQPPLNKCGFNQKGVSTSSDGITTTLSGDQWAQLNVIADGNDIGDWNPGDGPAIHGLGNGAYWDPGRETVVVLVSGNVFEVVDDVPVNLDIYTDLAAARQQAATALAAKILSHM